MNILLSKKLADTDMAYLKERIDGEVSWIVPDSFDESGVLQKIDDADMVLGGLITESILTRGKHVNYFQIPWSGVDALDLKIINDSGATVCNSHSNATVVAEHAVSLLFSIARKIPYHDRGLRQGNWNRVQADGGNAISPFSSQITNSRVLLVGFGAIGQSVARMLSGFGCSISVVNNSGVIPEASRSHIANVARSDRLHEMLGSADVVIVCVPLTRETNGLFDATAFEQLRPEALLVSVARGKVIDQSALYDALVQKRIQGAAIDTWYSYPGAGNQPCFPSSDYPFHELDNLVLSPHRAGYVQGSFPHLDDVVENINRTLVGESVKNVISAVNGY